MAIEGRPVNELLEELKAQPGTTAAIRAAHALGQLEVKNSYISLQGRIILVGLIVLFAMGAGFVQQSNVYQAKLEALAIANKDLAQKVSQLQNENVALKKVAAPFLKTIDRGAKYMQVNYKVNPEKAKLLSRLAMEEAVKTNTPYERLIAIMEKESSFNCNATSFNGSSFGCMQVNCYWHCKDYGVQRKDLFVPHINIPIAVDIYRKYRAQTGSSFAALKRYSGKKDDDPYNEAYANDIIRREQPIKRFLNA